jgi:hypothetical protein
MARTITVLSHSLSLADKPLSRLGGFGEQRARLAALRAELVTA